MVNIQSSQPLTVLIVEPFETIRTMIANVLNQLSNIVIIQSSNASDALEKLEYNDIGLIIAEWQLPTLSGIEFLKKVRTNTRTAKIPFVMTSATIEQSHVVQAIQCGVSEYVVKPFSSKILKSRLQRALTKPVRPCKEAPESTESTEQNNDLHVLIVDDVADNIKIISDILRKDYKIKAALNGKKALQICAKDPQPDIILLDIMMPDMDGLEVCRRLKDDPSTQHITVIFLSALEQTEHIVKGLELGAVDYITKPANPAIVKSRVQAHCRSIESNRLMRAQIDTMLENARLRDEFDSVNQTELVKPVADIKHSTSQLAANLHEPEKAQQYIDFIQQSCAALQLHVDSTASLNKIERKEYQFKPQKQNFTTVLKDALGHVSEIVKRKQIKVHNTENTDCHFNGEYAITHALLTHLLKNALEGTRSDPSIQLSATQNDKYVVFKIHNPDPVPEPIRGQFFDKFVTYGKPDHAGIGTYTAKLLTEIQGGFIEYRTDDNLGTEVFVSLPLA
ncbi:response regulator [Pseudoalteromonas sp. MMG005]|uniref:response regulator n=1 Tax=Pseudoalteromonas sp. MMG005 TaxID=2822682 RepID=UPI001FFD19FA|nr:response regulator [Pseudoalteromonas sp. MMG005]